MCYGGVCEGSQIAYLVCVCVPPLPPPSPLYREMAVRYIPDALEAATSYSEYQLILEISMTLANDHGEPY